MATATSAKTNATQTADTVLAELRRAAESEAFSRGGYVWLSVYLPNVQSALRMNPYSFAGFLSALEGKGLYRPADKVFGYVRET